MSQAKLTATVRSRQPGASYRSGFGGAALRRKKNQYPERKTHSYATLQDVSAQSQQVTGSLRRRVDRKATTIGMVTCATMPSTTTRSCSQVRIQTIWAASHSSRRWAQPCIHPLEAVGSTEVTLVLTKAGRGSLYRSSLQPPAPLQTGRDRTAYL